VTAPSQATLRSCPWSYLENDHDRGGKVAKLINSEKVGWVQEEERASSILVKVTEVVKTMQGQVKTWGVNFLG
jgi:hypothetical protein